jgi:hypothetical protein
MTGSVLKRAMLLCAASALIALTTAATAPAATAPAATVYACVKPNHQTHVFLQKPKCKKDEKKLAWALSGTAGGNGSNGASGLNGAAGARGEQGAAGTPGAPGSPGAPGEPRSAKHLAALISPGAAPVSLFSADGINYTMACSSFFGRAIEQVEAAGPSGESFGSGIFHRPSGQETKPTDLTTLIETELLGPTPKSIATDAETLEENSSNQFTQYGIWTVSVERASSVTLLHLWMTATSFCALEGSAITLPD